MNIRPPNCNAPQFSGVHRGWAEHDTDAVNFTYQYPGEITGYYHTSGQDTIDFKPVHRLYRLMEARDWEERCGIDPEFETGYNDTCKALADKEPMNRFFAAIKKGDADAAWALLKNPEVNLIGHLPEVLLGNDGFFEVIKNLTGSTKQAKHIIKKILTKDLAVDLNSVGRSQFRERKVEHRSHWIPQGWTHKRDDRDIRKSAEKMADDAFREYKR